MALVPAGRVAVSAVQPPLSPVMPVPLVLKPLWSPEVSDRLVEIGSQLAPPSVEASRKA
ncbi:MAG: hypothetical protein R2734_20130 [Nocardioides sp.]